VIRSLGARVRPLGVASASHESTITREVSHVDRVREEVRRAAPRAAAGRLSCEPGTTRQASPPWLRLRTPHVTL
jgi:hypothetical protein